MAESLVKSPLGVDDLCLVQEELYAARNCWYNLGLKLGLKPDVLDAIETRCSEDPDKCFRETLKNYLKTTTPSWRALVEALRSPPVGQLQLAEKVEQKCCPALWLETKDTQPPPLRDESLPNPQGSSMPISSQVITTDDPDEKALRSFLNNRGLTDHKWISYFHKHDITKPDQIHLLPVKGSEELYMALSSRGNAQENADLRKILGIIEKPANSIQIELEKAGLQSSYWSAVFEKKLGVTSTQALQHLGSDEYPILQDHVRLPWEKKALQKLLKIDDEGGTFQRQHEKQRERLKNKQTGDVVSTVKETKHVPQSFIPRHDVQERKKQNEELFSILGLTDFCPQKLTLRQALEIREDTLLTTTDVHQHRKEAKTDPKNNDEDTSKQVQCVDPKLFPFLILQKIMAFDYKSRAKLICYSSSPTTKESKRVSTLKIPDKDLFLDEGDEDDYHDSGTMTIHPMDGLLALLHCSDNFLRQDLFSRLATCQLAIPLLMPDPFAPQITFPLWAMRSIVREWKCTQSSGRTVSHEESLVSYRAPLVSFMRFGTHNMSKSHVLNSVISESKHDIFFHFNCDGGSARQLLVNGLVEVCWYLPSDHIFPDVISFANLHGDARQFPKQVSFLSKVSFMNFVFLNEEDLDSKALQMLKELATAPGGLVMLRTKPTADNTIWCEQFMLLTKLVPKQKFSVIKLNRRNEADITDELRRSINKTLHEKWAAAAGHRYTFEEFSGIVHSCNKEDSAEGKELAITIIVDEEEETDCIRGKELADTLKKFIDEFINAHPDRSPKELLPLQSSDLWHKWAFKDKEQYRHTLRGHCGIEEYSAQQRKEMKLIRSKQYDQLQQLTPLMKSFIQCILLHKGGVRKYFLDCLQLHLDNVSRKQLSLLRSQYQKKRREFILAQKKVNERAEKDCRHEIDELNRKLVDASFGLEHILRETCQIYEAVRACENIADKRVEVQMFRLPAIAAELMIDGYPLELMDGDAAHVPMTWVSAVLDEVREKLQNPRVLVLSILGLQGTGKSTLINTMFGLRFSVSAGRCTRGAFMQLIPIHTVLKHECKCDYLLIVDTEGLRAPELDYQQTQKHDNELATFIIGLANLTVINIPGETTGDLDDILQTAIHAFLRMKEVKLTSSCQFVHQNVTAVMAGEKGMQGHIKFKEKLNYMTQAAAKEQNLEGQYKSFSQIIEFNEEDDVYHFPGLWKGDPPMAPVNPGYSRKAQEMKLQLINSAKRKSASHICANVIHLSVFKTHMKELWKAVLHENFVFSFKNTIEIAAYNTLEATYGQWSLSFEEKMMHWEQKAQNELKGCPGVELPRVYERLTSELASHVQKIYQSLKEDLEVLFKESPESEIIAKWKNETEIRLRNLHKQLQTHAEGHCKLLGTSRQTLAIVDEMKEGYCRNILEIHVKELVSQLEQGALNDEQLEQRFNEQWIKWITELKSIPVHMADVCVPSEVEKSLIEAFHSHTAIVIKKLTNKSLRKWGSPLKLIIESEVHMKAMTSNKTYLVKAVRFMWPEKCLHTAQEKTDNILEEVHKYLTEKQNENFNPSFTNELLHILSEEIDKFNSNATDFKFKPEYRVDIAMTACGYALRKFEQMQKAYRKKIDPIEYMEREMRESILGLFKNQYFQATQEKAAAVTLCDFLSKSLKKQVISSLSVRIVQDMRGKSPHFQSKPALKGKILLDIGEELNQNADFVHCALYLEDIEQSLQWWIKHYTRQHCEQGEPSRLVQLAMWELSNLSTCIAQTAHEVTQDILPKQEAFNIKDWLTKFHDKLQGRLEIDVTELRNLVGAQQLKDVHNFNEEIGKGLQKLEATLKTQLLSMDVSAMDQWERKPYDIIFKHLAGCTEQCPFCHEQCDHTNAWHISTVPHSVEMHRTHHLRGQKRLDVCTSLVGTTDLKFKNTTRGKVDKYPQWAILDDRSVEASLYWKWVVGHYTSEFVGTREAQIPYEWKALSWNRVRKDLENTYHV